MGRVGFRVGNMFTIDFGVTGDYKRRSIACLIAVGRKLVCRLSRIKNVRVISNIKVFFFKLFKY